MTPTTPSSLADSTPFPITLASSPPTRRARWLAGVALALHAAWATAAGAAGAGDPTVEYRLDNGLRVIVKPDHRAPTVVQMVWYKAGSIDEFNGTTGVAHVLEHMMFKGTRTLGPGLFSKRVAALGGSENAFTNHDYTAYFQRVEKTQLPEIMRLESDRMANLVLSEEEFSKEIQVVMEERRLRTDDQPPALLWEQLQATAFIAAPERNPVIGWMDDLRNLRYTDARDWYQRWYAPNNAVLIVVGDVEPEAVHALAMQTYGKIAAHALPVRKPQIEPVQRGPRRVVLKASADHPSVLIAFKAPRLERIDANTDPYALDVLAGVLDGYANSRLQRHLVRERRLADDVGADYSPAGRSQALFVLSATPAKGHTALEVETALREEIARIAREGVDDAELARVKAQMMAAQVYKRDSAMGQAMEIGSYEMAGISWRQIDQLLDKINAVTADQVKQVAARYFHEDQMTVAELQPLPADPAAKRATPMPTKQEMR